MRLPCGPPPQPAVKSFHDLIMPVAACANWTYSDVVVACRRIQFMKMRDVLQTSNVAARIPAQDLDRAKAFYAQKLGLTPAEERPGGLRYRCGSGEFALFQSSGAASGDHTQLAWEVDDLDAAVEMLRSRGVVFEEYDLADLTTVNGIAEVAGAYPSKRAVGERAAWFKDSEGNLLSLGQPLR